MFGLKFGMQGLILDSGDITVPHKLIDNIELVKIDRFTRVGKWDRGIQVYYFDIEIYLTITSFSI